MKLWQALRRFNELQKSAHLGISNTRGGFQPVKFRAPTFEEYKGKTSFNRIYFDHKDTQLQYKLLRSEARLVQRVLEANGFVMTEGHSWNIVWSNGHIKNYVYEGTNSYQRINHFPTSYNLTRKDNLCENLARMQRKYGKETFNIIPETYVLPDEFDEFYDDFMQLKSQHVTSFWIVKPNALSRGRGIYIVLSRLYVD